MQFALLFIWKIEKRGGEKKRNLEFIGLNHRRGVREPIAILTVQKRQWFRTAAMLPEELPNNSGETSSNKNDGQSFAVKTKKRKKKKKKQSLVKARN